MMTMMMMIMMTKLAYQNKVNKQCKNKMNSKPSSRAIENGTPVSQNQHSLPKTLHSQRPRASMTTRIKDARHQELRERRCKFTAQRALQK